MYERIFLDLLSKHLNCHQIPNPTKLHEQMSRRSLCSCVNFLYRGDLVVAGFGKSCDFGHSSVQIKATEPKCVNTIVTLYILIREKP